jgi:hypothetical protein
MENSLVTSLLAPLVVATSMAGAVNATELYKFSMSYSTEGKRAINIGFETVKDSDTTMPFGDLEFGAQTTDIGVGIKTQTPCIFLSGGLSVLGVLGTDAPLPSLGWYLRAGIEQSILGVTTFTEYETNSHKQSWAVDEEYPHNNQFKVGIKRPF